MTIADVCTPDGWDVLPRPSLAQERLWVIHQRDPESLAYNLCWANRLSGSLDRSALRRAIHDVVLRHESLRTTFVDLNGAPRLRVDADVRCELELVEGVDEVSAMGRIREAGRTKFDLEQGPLARFMLFRLTNQEHILLVVVHHIVCDGWSMGVLYRELEEGYESHHGVVARPGKPPPVPFNDLAARERARYESGGFDGSISYWRSRLHGTSDSGVPLFASRPPLPSFRGAQARRRCGPDVLNAMTEFAKGERVSLFMVMLAEWATLLSRYGAGEDLVVGVPVACRSEPDSRDVIGFFANTVAVRCELTGEPTFRELVNRMRRDLVKDQAHHSAPFDKVVDALHLPRSGDGNVLFHHMLVFLNVPNTKLSLSGLDVRAIAVDIGTSQFDLSLNVERDSSGLDLVLEYATDLYDAPMAEQILSNLETLMRGSMADPDDSVYKLALLDAKQISEVVTRWNDTSSEHPWSGDCLYDVVRKQGERTPDAIAVSCRDSELTYGQLIDRAESLASKLAFCAVGPESCVGILMQRSTGMAVTLVATAAAGGAFVPLDPTWPSERLRHILEETQARVVLVSEEYRQLAMEVAGGIPIVQLTHTGSQVPSDRRLRIRHAVRLPKVQPHNLAHIFYTSGSTGTPKGVAVEHRSIVNRLAWAVGAYGITEKDRVLVNSPFSFDPFVWELFCPLMVGGRAILTPPDTTQDPSMLAAATLRSEGVTVAEFVPSILVRLLETAIGEDLQTLRAVLCGSDVMPPDLPARFFQVSGAALYNVYGPTEVSIDAMCWRCHPSGPTLPVPIGFPIANMSIYVLDDHLAPLPIGVSGEICIGGIGVARGYLRNREETDIHFVENPFTPGEKLYRTGDLGRRRRDGAIEFLGRRDRQIKLNGIRVEPGEVEAALSSHSAVVEAAVVPVPRKSLGGLKPLQLTAFVVGAQLPPTIELREHLFDKLPRALVPSSFVTLDRLPVDGNGKVDRHALLGLALQQRPDAVTTIPPRTKTEQFLFGVWASVLGDVKFGVTDNFFEIGGDSILSMQVVAMARLGGLDLTARDVTRAQTIEELSRVNHRQRLNRVTESCTVAPLAPAQCWFFEREFQAPDYFNDAVLLRLSSECAVELLLEAIHHVVASHPELGHRFEKRDNHLVQVSSSERPDFQITRRDLTGSSEILLEEARRSAAQKVHASLSLKDGRLGAGLLISNGRERELMLLFHHLVIDAVSWRVILREISATYDRLKAGGVGPTFSSTPFGLWTTRMRRQVSVGEYDADTEFWMAQQGSPLPRDSTGRNLVADIGVVRTRLDGDTTQRLLRSVPRLLDAPVGAVLLGALLRAFQRRLGVKSVLIELEGHGREEERVEDLDLLDTVGWFTSLYPVAFQVAPNSDAESAVSSAKRALAAVPCEGASFGWLRYHGHPEIRKRMAGLITPELSFNYAGQFDHLYRKSEGAFTQEPYPPGWLQSHTATRSHLIEINCFVLHGNLHIEWAYGSQIHRKDTIESLSNMTNANLVELALLPDTSAEEQTGAAAVQRGHSSRPTES
jgi:amino acid adenylation domain-containing protein/non-ribosomal peptide synthase protein (TIGR01720 family)